MMRTALKTITKTGLLAMLVGGGSFSIWFYAHRHSSDYQIEQLESQKRQLEKEKQQLQTVVQRLSDEKRVAEVLVTDQKTVDGTLRTTLLFDEYKHDGSTLPPRLFTIEGNIAHIDAMVIKFDRGLIAQNDPLRGRSVALFHRLFGDKQSPQQAFAIDPPGQPPAIYRGDPTEPATQAAFEKELWQNFWRLAEDKDYRQSKGVRIANGQGIWGPFSPDRLYIITLDSDGGLNLTSEPLKGIYKDALQQRLSAVDQSK
jgi:hypothetical protein